MQQTLIIYLRAEGNSQPDWVVVSDGVILQSVLSGDASLLSQLASGKEVIVIVPQQDVLLTSTNLPKMNRSQLSKALPFALEEQVIDDVDALHFAYLHQPNEALSVAIVAKNKMQTWLDLLKTWNVQADIMMPLMFALPLIEQTFVVVVLSDMAIVRMDAYQGFASDINNLNALLNMALQATEDKPEVIYIKNYSGHSFALSTDIKVKEDRYAAHQLQMDAAIHALKFPFINLLQASYKSKKSRLPEMRKLWNTAMMLGAAWLILLFLYPAISYWILHHRASDIDTQMTAIYKRHFPESSNIVAPKLRLQEKLQAYTGAGDNKLFVWLGTLGQGMSEASGIALKRIDYQQNHMTVELTAHSSEVFSRLTDFLTRHGLSVKQNNVNLQGDSVNVTMTVE